MYQQFLIVIIMDVCCSLHSNSALDINVKSRLVKDVLNVAGFVLPNKEDVMPGPQPPTDWRYCDQDDDNDVHYVCVCGVYKLSDVI